MALCNDDAIVARPRELPEPLEHGPLGGCLRISITCDGIGICLFILRVQSFVVGV